MIYAENQHWHPVSKLLHWLVALLIFGQFVLGWLAKSWHMSPTKLDLFVWHKSTGILVLVGLGSESSARVNTLALYCDSN